MRGPCLALAVAAASCTSWFEDAPDAGSPPSFVHLELAGDGTSISSTGVLYREVVTALGASTSDPDAGADPGGAPLPGVTVTFATSMAGVAFTPPTAVTGRDGAARSTVVVPFGAQIVASASSPGSGLAIAALNGIVAILPTVEEVMPVFIDGVPGIVYQVRAAITATDTSGPVVGLSVAFAQIGVSANSNPFAPPSILTDAAGVATSYVFVPDVFGDPGALSAVVVAGGATVELTVPAPP